MAKSRMFGESKLKRKLRRFPVELTADLGVAMSEGAKELRDEIERIAPKDKGDLGEAAHFIVSKDKLSAKVGYSTREGFKRKWKNFGGFVAQYQEFGTKHAAAQPFVRPAFRNKLKWILDRIDYQVNRTLRRASSGNF